MYIYIYIILKNFVFSGWPGQQVIGVKNSYSEAESFWSAPWQCPTPLKLHHYQIGLSHHAFSGTKHLLLCTCSWLESRGFTHRGKKKKKGYAKNTLYVLIHLFVNPGNGLDETYTHAHENNNNNKRIIEVFLTFVFNLTYNKGLQIAVLVWCGGPARWVTRIMGWGGCVKPLWENNVLCNYILCQLFRDKLCITKLKSILFPYLPFIVILKTVVSQTLI